MNRSSNRRKDRQDQSSKGIAQLAYEHDTALADADQALTTAGQDAWLAYQTSEAAASKVAATTIEDGQVTFKVALSDAQRRYAVAMIRRKVNVFDGTTNRWSRVRIPD